jgi:hypothetical protein
MLERICGIHAFAAMNRRGLDDRAARSD